MTKLEEAGLSAARLARIRPALEKYIGDDKIAGVVALLARHGEVVCQECLGLMDRENQNEMQLDTIFRIYSMTKPVVCVALMTLYEQGMFQLFDPVSEFIPAFADLKVYAGESDSMIDLDDLEREVTIHDLLTHTSGLTYHWLEYGRVEELYREAEVSSKKPLAEYVDDLLQLPLAFQPGTAWRYSTAHDVVANLVEIISGQTLDIYLHENLFDPLGMVDTGFYVATHNLDRFAAMYGSHDVFEPDMTITRWFGDAIAGTNRLLAHPASSLESSPHQVFRGGHGLVSTVSDYFRFCQMMLNTGELDGNRVLGRKIAELMIANHLTSALLPYELGGIYHPGRGYGLGFSTVMDVGLTQSPGSFGDFSWIGAANTSFWIDPKEEFIGILMAQFQPIGHHQISDDFKVVAYSTIVD